MGRGPGDRRGPSLPHVSLSPRGRRLTGWLAALGVVGLVALGVRLIGGAEGGEGPDAGGAVPSPSFRTTGGAIAFGTALDPETGVVEVTSQTTRFGPGDTFAYAALGITPVPMVWVEVVRLSGEAPEVVQTPAPQSVPADRLAIAFTVPASDLIDAWGPGEYRMRIFVSEGGVHAAEGVFTLIAPSPSATAAPP